LSITTKQAAAGQFVTVTVSGYERWDFLSLTLGDVRIGQVYTDVNGAAKITLRVPTDTAAGKLSLEATGSSGTPSAAVTLNVTR